MSLTLEEYRQKIGLFNSRRINYSKVQSTTEDNSTSRMKIYGIIVCILSFLILLPHSNLTTTSNSTHRASTTFSKSSNNLQSKSSSTFSSILSLNWSYQGMSNNKLQSIINGNRRAVGYKLAVWNCGRGLISGDSITNKFLDVKMYAQSKNPHVLGVIETDIHSNLSTIKRINKYSTEVVKSYLDIPGYSLVLHQSHSISYHRYLHHQG